MRICHHELLGMLDDLEIQAMVGKLDDGTADDKRRKIVADTLRLVKDKIRIRFLL